MKRVLTAIVLIPLVLLVLFKAPMWLFTLVVGIVAMGAAWEYLGLVSAYGVATKKRVILSLVAALFLAIAERFGTLSGSAAFPIIICIGACGPLLVVAAAMRADPLREALPIAALNALAIPYVGLTLACLPIIRSGRGGTFWMIYLFSVVWSGDIFAYYVGRAIGRHKLAPRISPGKTWEGTIASLVTSCALGVALFVYRGTILKWIPAQAMQNPVLAGFDCSSSSPSAISLWVVGLMSITVNAAAQLGDLVESMLKRGAGVKDSGNILPGHGGILDRIDALLFAAPVFWLWFYAMMNEPCVKFLRIVD